MVFSLINDLMRAENNCHDGNAHVNVFRAFDRKKDTKTLDFLDFVQIPPKATIGRHKHGENCEWYVIIGGKGKMLFKGEVVDVKPWDVLVNPPYGEHALSNDSDEDIHVVVFQFSGEGMYEEEQYER